MKIKQRPEDFCVEEVSLTKPLKAPAKYMIYELCKRGLDTKAALCYISQKSGIPQSEFGIAGMKDRHAQATQEFTIPSKHELPDLSEKSFSIKFLGFSDSPIKIGDLAGNRFKIIVRELMPHDIKRLNESAGQVGWQGVPNYFDSQRFGSVIGGEFIAKYVVKRDYESAVKIFMTGYTGMDSMQKNQEKRIIHDGWANLGVLEIKNPLFAHIISKLKSGGWLPAYMAIPHSMRELYVSVYQSHIWNECVKELIREVIPKENTYPVEYRVGKLIFFRGASQPSVEKLPKTFRMVAPRSSYPESELAIINKILEKEKVAIKDFDIQPETQNFFKWYERTVMLVPKHLTIGTPKPDEFNQNSKKVDISFELPKGSYATVVLKGLFGK